MKKTINLESFIKEFENYGRRNSFSEQGLEAIFDYLESADPDSELDVVAVCCEFSEYGSVEEAVKEIGIEDEGIEDIDDLERYLSRRDGYLVCEEDCIVIVNS